MSDTSKIAKNLRAFQIAINSHDRENPDHTAYGIGLAHFDLERLGFDEGEEVLPGITIHADSGVTGNFRVLCDGQHDEDLETAAVGAAEELDLAAGGPAWHADVAVGLEVEADVPVVDRNVRGVHAAVA